MTIDRVVGATCRSNNSRNENRGHNVRKKKTGMFSYRLFRVMVTLLSRISVTCQFCRMSKGEPRTTKEPMANGVVTRRRSSGGRTCLRQRRLKKAEWRESSKLNLGKLLTRYRLEAVRVKPESCLFFPLADPSPLPSFPSFLSSSLLSLLFSPRSQEGTQTRTEA